MNKISIYQNRLFYQTPHLHLTILHQVEYDGIFHFIVTWSPEDLRNNTNYLVSISPLPPYGCSEIRSHTASARVSLSNNVHYNRHILIGLMLLSLMVRIETYYSKYISCCKIHISSQKYA